MKITRLQSGCKWRITNYVELADLLLGSGADIDLIKLLVESRCRLSKMKSTRGGFI